MASKKIDCKQFTGLNAEKLKSMFNYDENTIINSRD